MKKIKIILYHNEEKQEYEKEIIVSKDKSFSLQNENESVPVMTIALDKNGDLMINTNSSDYIKEKSKSGAKA